MAAPLIVRSNDDARADVHEVIVLLHDFTFRNPSEILAELSGGAATAAGMPMPQSHAGMMAGQGMAMGHAGMSGRAMPMAGGHAMDLNDVNYEA